MIALLAITLCAILYRARGAGWPETYLGIKDYGVVKNLCLLLLAVAFALPIYFADLVEWYWIVPSVIGSFITGRAAHGEFFHAGRQTPKRERDKNAWIGWVTDWKDGSVKEGGDGRSFVSDFFGNGLTGFIHIAPFVPLLLILGLWVPALIYTVAGFLGKTVAYLIGWYPLYHVRNPEFTQTGAGEWLTGLFLGIGVYAGWLYLIS